MTEPQTNGEQPDQPREEVSADDVMAALGGQNSKVEEEVPGAGEVRALKRLEPIQRAGLNLAYCVGGAIAVVILIVLLDWVFRMSSQPTLPVNPEDYDKIASKLVQDYKTLTEITHDRATKIFDLVIVKALLPVFTSILGYIFGTTTQGTRNEG